MRKRDRLVERCRIAMAGGSWWTIPQMAAMLGCSETGASARIRDQRKAKYGRHKVVKRRAGNFYEYRMMPPKKSQKLSSRKAGSDE